MDTSGEETAT
jgi:hypothetical protein